VRVYLDEGRKYVAPRMSGGHLPSSNELLRHPVVSAWVLVAVCVNAAAAWSVSHSYGMLIGADRIVGALPVGGKALSAAEVWVCGPAAVIILLASVYLSLLLHGAANERVISDAVTAMLAARQHQDVPPQRKLLRAITETLADQERSAARIAAAVNESLLPGSAGTELPAAIKEIIGLPEPQVIVTDFFAEYAGDAGSAGAFTAFAGQLIRAETKRVYADLDGDASQDLDKLAVLALEGRIAAVALAGLEVRGGPRSARVPLMTDGDPGAVEQAVRGLEQATRRQMRLATLLHAQAAASLRLRAVPRGQRLGEAVWSRLRRHTRGSSDGDSVSRNAALRLRVHRLLAAPRLKLSRAPFRQDDLDSLEVVFDAIGEAVTSALECLAGGEPMRALYLLVGIRVPVPSGLPGRIYNQDSLAQVRPLVALGVRHRLAVCRWAAVAADHAASGEDFPGQSGLLSAWSSDREGEE
jgi:hypothetical protein